MKTYQTLLALLAVGVQYALGNNALALNPSSANATITTRGSDFLWAVFAIMLFCALLMMAWTFSIAPGRRAFHWIGVAILFTASVAYYSMASNLGQAAVAVEFVRYKSDIFTNTSVNPYTRAIWYARYIDWTITTPLLLLELLLATGTPLGGIFITVFFDLLMIITGLIGALVASRYKWGFFTGGCIAMFYIFYVLLIPGRHNARAISIENHRSYITSTLILLVLWLNYPIAWGLSDGGNVISSDGEMVYYGILDILAKPVFLFWHLYSLRKVPYESFQLQSGHFSAYSSDALSNLNEKHHTRGLVGDGVGVAAGHNGVVNNHTHGVTGDGVGAIGHGGGNNGVGAATHVSGNPVGAHAAAPAGTAAHAAHARGP